MGEWEKGCGGDWETGRKGEREMKGLIDKTTP
jgi:hypothetical protein